MGLGGWVSAERVGAGGEGWAGEERSYRDGRWRAVEGQDEGCRS